MVEKKGSKNTPNSKGSTNSSSSEEVVRDIIKAGNMTDKIVGIITASVAKKTKYDTIFVDFFLISSSNIMLPDTHNPQLKITLNNNYKTGLILKEYNI